MPKARGGLGGADCARDFTPCLRRHVQCPGVAQRAIASPAEHHQLVANRIKDGGVVVTRAGASVSVDELCPTAHGQRLGWRCCAYPSNCRVSTRFRNQNSQQYIGKRGSVIRRKDLLGSTHGMLLWLRALPQRGNRRHSVINVVVVLMAHRIAINPMKRLRRNSHTHGQVAARPSLSRNAGLLICLRYWHTEMLTHTQICLYL